VPPLPMPAGVHVTQIYFLNMMRAVEEVITRNSAKDEVDLTLESMCGDRVTDKWNNLSQCCINCTTLNNFRSRIHKVLEAETE